MLHRMNQGKMCKLSFGFDLDIRNILNPFRCCNLLAYCSQSFAFGMCVMHRRRAIKKESKDSVAEVYASCVCFENYGYCIRTGCQCKKGATVSLTIQSVSQERWKQQERRPRVQLPLHTVTRNLLQSGLMLQLLHCSVHNSQRICAQTTLP